MIIFKRFNFIAWAVLLLLFSATILSISNCDRQQISASAATEVILQPGATGKDAFVSDFYPGVDSVDTNFGNETYLMIGASAPTWHTYIQFDLSSIPGDATIESASLGLDVYETNGESNTFTVHRVTSLWGEDTITYNNQPSFSASYGTATISANGWTAIDVKGIIADAITSSNYGIALRYFSHSGDAPCYFYSSEQATSSYRPKLTIAYSGGTPLPSCSDGIKNGDETGVDCGGSCVACAQTVTHKTCVNNLCQTVVGEGSDTCSNDSQCAATSTDPQPERSHKECVDNTCQTVAGQGNDQCQNDDVCLENQGGIEEDDDPESDGDENQELSEKEGETVVTSDTPDKKDTYIEKINTFLNENNIPLASLIAAGTLSVISVLASLSSFITAEVTIKEYLLTLINYLSTIFLARKKDKRGLVFDASTSKPLAGALINLYSYPEMRLISSSISDLKGRYSFAISTGKYVMSVVKRGYIFPSVIAKNTISYNKDLYLGQTIESDDAGVINNKIALDPTPKAQPAKRKVYKIILYSNLLRLIVMSLGTLLAIVMLIYYPETKNFLILSSYVILWILEYIIENKEVKFCHVLALDDKKPVDLALIRIISEDGKLRQTCVSDQSGRVLIESQKPSDIIAVERMGYKKEQVKAGREGLIEGKTFLLKKIG